MIIGLGIDLVDNHRFEAELARGDWCVDDGIFLKSEIPRCNGLQKSSQWYASCFAAKEATLKALNIAAADLAAFHDVEVKTRSGGSYDVDLHGQAKTRRDQLGVRHISVCIAQGPKLTIASVVLCD